MIVEGGRETVPEAMFRGDLIDSERLLCRFHKKMCETLDSLKQACHLAVTVVAIRRMPTKVRLFSLRDVIRCQSISKMRLLLMELLLLFPHTIEERPICRWRVRRAGLQFLTPKGCVETA